MFKLPLIEPEDIEYDQEPPGRVRERARKILAILREYREKSPTFDQHHTRWAAGRISDLISDAVAADVIYNELAVLIGSSNSASELVRFACSIAGSVHFAKKYSVAEIGSVDIQPVDCWAIIKSMVYREDRFGHVFDLGLIFANSVFAGSRAVVTIGSDRSRWWAINLGLLGARRKPITFHTSYQLLGASMICRVSRFNGQVSVEGAGAVDSTKAVNSELAKSRSRQHTSCPFEFSCDCGICDVGLNECDRSTYTRDTTVIQDLAKEILDGESAGQSTGAGTGS